MPVYASYILYCVLYWFYVCYITFVKMKSDKNILLKELSVKLTCIYFEAYE